MKNKLKNCDMQTSNIFVETLIMQCKCKMGAACDHDWSKAISIIAFDERSSQRKANMFSE